MEIQVGALRVEEQIGGERVGVAVEQGFLDPPQVPSVLYPVEVHLPQTLRREVQDSGPRHRDAEQCISGERGQMLPNACFTDRLRVASGNWRVLFARNSQLVTRHFLLAHGLPTRRTSLTPMLNWRLSSPCPRL